MSADTIRRPIPRNVSVLMIAILGTGFAAAQAVSPVLWTTTFAMLALIVFGLRRGTEQPDADADPVELPARTRRIVCETFEQLPKSDAADLLRGVIRPARTLYAAAEANESLSAALLRDCAELVEVSCTTAAELSRTEQLLARDERAWKAVEKGSVRQGLSTSRDLMRRRLVDAADALGKLYVQSVERGTISSDRVAELAAELNAEVSVRKRVSAEMQALLDN